VRCEIEKHTTHRVHMCSNPEFLKEGAAVDDFMRPDRVVVGVDSEHARETVERLYGPFVRTGNPVIFMDIASAEITKYAANAMLATRISFMNMIANLCERVGADVALVRKGVGTDERIGPAFLFAGCGYGGSCFPKDVKALIRTLAEHGVDAGILEAVEGVNDRQKHVLVERAQARFGQDLTGRRFAVWGLSFKPETDDLREAASLVVIDGLLAAGAAVIVHDPVAMSAARTVLDRRVAYAPHNYDALEGADALIIVTEWGQYRTPDFDRMKSLMKAPVILDGRNLFEPEHMSRLGFEYHGMGRRPAKPPHLT
jgi:UDPglucose 6-dehydrogenase